MLTPDWSLKSHHLQSFLALGKWVGSVQLGLGQGRAQSARVGT